MHRPFWWFRSQWKFMACGSHRPQYLGAHHTTHKLPPTTKLVNKQHACMQYEPLTNSLKRLIYVHTWCPPCWYPWPHARAPRSVNTAAPRVLLESHRGSGQRRYPVYDSACVGNDYTTLKLEGRSLWDKQLPICTQTYNVCLFRLVLG